jgi:hypothetical protein
LRSGKSGKYLPENLPVGPRGNDLAGLTCMASGEVAPLYFWITFELFPYRSVSALICHHVSCF